MWAKAKSFFERQRRYFMAFVLIVIVLFWIGRPFLPALSFEVSISTTASMTLFFVLLLLDYVVGLRKEENIRFFRNEKEATRALTDFVESKRPKNVRMIEYSSATMEYLISALKDSPATRRIDLLVCHPGQAISTYQRSERICWAMKRLQDVVVDYDKVKIRCYTQRASVRGRKFDDSLIAIGWYTYNVKDHRVKQITDQQIWGDENPVIVADVKEREGKVLGEMFDRVFTSLWNRATPPDEAFKTACDSCAVRDGCTSQLSTEWLRLVSEA